MRTLARTVRILCLLVLSLPTIAFTQQWMTGKLIDTERQEVHSGSTTTFNSDSDSKDGKRSKSGSSQTSEDVDVYQMFTIKTADKTYVVRQKLNFPWSKPANIVVGENVKFSVQGNKVVMIDDDQKQQKASVVKASMNQ